MKINNLSGDLIFPNQVLETSKKQSSNTSNSNSNNNSSSSNASTYTVKSGDTLSGIAFKHNISISNLMRSEEHTSELQSRGHLVCRLLLEKKKKECRENKNKHNHEIQPQGES